MPPPAIQQFQPTTDPPDTPWPEWRANFELYLAMKEKEADRQVRMRTIGLTAAQRADQQGDIDALQMTRTDKVCEFMSCLGSEALRLFRAKAGPAWANPNNLANDKTVTAALEICNTLFDEVRHPLIALIDLYSARKKSSESVEHFVTRLRHIARSCKLGDQEERHLMFCLVYSCTDKEPLEKIVQTYRDYPTLQQVIEILLTYETTRKETPQLLGRSGRSRTEMMAAKAYDSSSTDESGNDSDLADTIAAVLHARKMKKGTGNNRNYRIPESNRGKRGNNAHAGGGGNALPAGRHEDRCSNCNTKNCPAMKGGTCRAKGTRCYVCDKPDHWCPRKKKKAVQQAPVTTAATGDGNRIFVEVGLQTTPSQPTIAASFIADTGAPLTTLVESSVKEKFPTLKMASTNREFMGFGGAVQRAIGKFKTKLSYQNGRETEAFIYVVKVKDNLNLLGLEEMGRLGLKIDTEQKCLINVIQETNDVTCSKEVVESTACWKQQQAKAMGKIDQGEDGSNQLDDLKRKYPQVFSNTIGLMRGYEHMIRLKPDAVPVQMGLRQIPVAKEKPTEEELENSLQIGVMEKVPGAKSLWNSPLHAVLKPESTGGGVRVTADYSGTINPWIIPTLHPIPQSSEIFRRARHAKKLSKLDIVKAYWHLKIAESCRHLTAFNTHSHGLLQYARLPMGMTDSAASFQRAIEQCLQGIDGVVPYLDDILVWGATQEEHDKTLDAVFARLDRDGFRVNPNKCSINKSQVSMLGQLLTVTDAGLDIIPDPSRTTAVLEAPAPKDVKSLQRFLGMANYFSNYIPHFSTIAEPLNRLRRKGEVFKWSPEAEEAFQTIKRAISEPEVLVPFEPECHIHLQTDASIVGLGACLLIERAGELRPVAFATKTLTVAERNYSTPEQEALAVVWAMEKYNQFLFGRRFTLHSDQGSLRRLLSDFADKPTVSRRIQRWYDRLRQYEFNIVHIKGEKNFVAYYLSRLGEDNPPSDQPTLPDDDDEIVLVSALTDTMISHDELVEATIKDPICKTIKRYLRDGWPNQRNISQPDLKHYHKCKDEMSMMHSLLFRGDRVIIPRELQSKVLHRLHLGHPGIVRMKKLYDELYYWPAGRVDCEALVQSCIPCSQAEKSAKPPVVPTGEIPPPQQPWERLAIDITGPFWEAPQRHEYIVVLMDYFSKWPELLFTQCTTSATIIRWLTDIFNHWGCPLELISDNGPQFVSDEFEEFLAARNIKHITTPVYCPERNGLVERFNRVLKNSAQTHSGNQNRFRAHIMETVASFRSIAPADSASPAVLARGWNMRTPSAIYNPRFADGGVERREPMDLESRKSIVWEKAKKKSSAQPVGRHDRRKSRAPFAAGDIVQFVRPKSTVHKGQSPLSRPVKIVSQVSRWDYRLADGQVWNARRLRKFRPAMHRPFCDPEAFEEEMTLPTGGGTLDAPPAGGLRRGFRDRRPAQRLIEEC